MARHYTDIVLSKFAFYCLKNHLTVDKNLIVPEKYSQ